MKPQHLQNTRHGLWLLLCCAMIATMAVLGAITRLTESGLSITDWNPIMGAIPPLSDQDWQKAFHAYQSIPQYQILNSYMSLDAFKYIFFWEWLHRLWGRLIGLVFAIPLFWFASRRELARPLVWRLAVVLVLIGIQGFIGWYMVQSGLSVRTDVSPYRLALHLSFALIIYSIIFWSALDCLRRISEKRPFSTSFQFHGLMALLCLSITIVWGAFVAGLHAGTAYNTWPLMDGELLPSAAFTLLPRWLNIFENLALVQFVHRWLGPATMLIILTWVARANKLAEARTQRWLMALVVAALVQVALGLSTLLSHANIFLATCHQAGAICLLSLLLVNLRDFRLLRLPSQHH